MARPLRIEYPGACYHVVNRGNQRATVFHQPRFYQLFIDKLGEFALVYGRRRVEKERDQERSINEKLVKIEGELKRSLPAKESAI